MKFLIDADLPKSTSKVIRRLGFAVEDVRDIGLGNRKDNEIIKYAKRNNFIIITRDLDFGDILHYPIKIHNGVVILRLPYFFIAQQINTVLKKFLETVDKEDIKDALVIVELDKYRIRR